MSEEKCSVAHRYVVLGNKKQKHQHFTTQQRHSEDGPDLEPGTVQFYLLFVRDMFRRRSVPGKR